MATINKFEISNYSIVKVLDDTYTSTTEEFDIPSWASINGAGVFIFADNISWQASVDSGKIVVILSRESLNTLGYGRWPFEIRAIFPNGHISTLIKGDLRITPFV